MAQHKWHKEIKAWADGAEIEARFKDEMTGWSEWDSMSSTCRFSEDDWWEYRIKPRSKEPQYLYAYKDYVRDDGSTTSKITISSTQLDTENYIGKIKLEVEE